jgi:hypothetical protein
MPRICYVPKNFGKTRLNIISEAIRILARYAAAGYDMTLRQLYYQFIALDLFPEDRRWTWTGAKWIRDPNGTKNAEPNYDWLGAITNDARLAGLIDWNFLVDRTRELKTVGHWDSPTEIVETVAEAYRIDKWESQPFRPEVWIEKEALEGVFERVCQRLDVPLFACRGYTSQSEMWRAAQRLTGYADAGQIPLIFHFGDLDPSGVDMTRDIEDRLSLFSGVPVEVRRLALTMAQVEEFNPPPSPAKLTDCRAKAFVEEYGPDSWELDALEPDKLAELVTDEVEAVREEDLYSEAVELEREQRAALRVVSDRFGSVQKFLKRRGWLKEEVEGDEDEVE